MMHSCRLFGIRSRCKFCKSLPMYNTFEIVTGLIQDPDKLIRKTRKYWRSGSSVNHKITVVKTRYSAKMSRASISNAQNKVNIKKCKDILSKKIFSFKSVFCCSCFQTFWSTRDIVDVFEKKHIFYRVCWKQYPQNIIIL